jgi:hypothetical protein
MNDDLISRKWLTECAEEGWIKFDTEKDKNIFIHLVRDTAPPAQRNDDLMKIGDEVAFHWDDGRPDTVVVITHIGQDGFIDGMDGKGTLYASKNPQKWTKTGRYFPLVNLLLMEIRGE